MIAALRAQQQRFAAWSARSAERRLFGAIVTVGALAGVVRLSGLVKHQLIAWRFGVSDGVDAFFVAVMLPAFLAGLFESMAQASFVPTFLRVLGRDGRPAAARLFAGMTAATVALLAAGTLAVVANERALLHLVARGFAGDKLAHARALFHVLVPMFFVTSIAGLWSAVLNAERRFALAAIAPVLCALGPIVALSARCSLRGLAWATLGGAAGHAALVGAAVYRRGLPILPRWYGATPELREIARQALPMLAGALVLSANGVIDQTMASTLGSGSVAALEYGRRLADFAVGIAALAIGTTALPHFSRLAADGEYAAIRRTLRVYTRIIAAAGAVGVALMLPLSLPLVRLLLQRGAFSAADAVVVSHVQLCYVAQAPFYLIGILGVRLLSALGHNRTLLLVSCVNVVTNLVGDLVLMRVLGLPGIALSTTCVYVVSMCIILERVRKKLPCA